MDGGVIVEAAPADVIDNPQEERTKESSSPFSEPIDEAGAVIPVPAFVGRARASPSASRDGDRAR